MHDDTATPHDRLDEIELADQIDLLPDPSNDEPGAAEPVPAVPPGQKFDRVLTYPYEDEKSATIVVLHRGEFVNPDGEPDKRCWWVNTKGQKKQGSRWVFYHLPDLFDPKTKHIVVVEGEKKCDALQSRLSILEEFRGYTVTCPPGGAGGVKKTDLEFTPLLRESIAITLWPDAGAEGITWAKKLLERLREQFGRSRLVKPPPIFVVDLPRDVIAGWDCGDAIIEAETPKDCGFEDHQLDYLIRNAPTADWWENQIAAAPKPEKPPRFFPAHEADQTFADLYPLLYLDTKTFYQWDRDALVWVSRNDLVVKRVITEQLGERATSNHVDDVFALLRNKSFREANPFQSQTANAEWIFVHQCDLRLVRDGASYRLESHKPTPDRYPQSRLNAGYDPNAVCPRFESWMAQTWAGQADIPERMQLVYEMIGYALLPSCPVPAVFFLWGLSQMGKSTLLRIIEGVLGRENRTTLDIDAMTKNKFALRMLEGKMANLIFELPKGTMLPDGIIKMLSGGEPLLLEKKFADAYSGELTAKHLISTNHIPVSRDLTHAMWNRIKIISFMNAVPEGAKREIAKEIHSDPAERAGIIRYSIQGLLRVRASLAFTLPPTCRDALDEWRDEMDATKRFLDECCTLGKHLVYPTRNLYSAYRAFCLDGGYEAMNEKNFKRSLVENHGLTHDKTEDRKQRAWKGVTLSNPPASYYPRGEPTTSDQVKAAVAKTQSGLDYDMSFPPRSDPKLN